MSILLLCLVLEFRLYVCFQANFVLFHNKFICGLRSRFYSSELNCCASPTLIFIWCFSMVVPFLRFGEAITGGPHFPLTSDALKRVLTGEASHELLLSIGHAVGTTIMSCISYFSHSRNPQYFLSNCL